MKFIAISDTHCRHKEVKLPKGDVILHAGDCTYRGLKSEVLDFLQWFGSLPFKHKLFIAGNHDFYFEKAKPAEIQSIIPEGVTYLNDSGVEIDGIKIGGSPVTPWYFSWAFNRHRGPLITKHWQLIPDDTQILMTHGPAYGILDTLINDKHIGCKDLLQRIQEIKPKVHLFGHVHESYGSIKKGGTRFINACIVNEANELMNKPFVFDIK